MISIRASFVLSLIISIVTAGTVAAGAPSHMTIEEQTFSPAIQLDGTKWLVKIVTIKGLENYTVVAMHIPCTTTDSAAGVYHKTPIRSVSYKNYGCTAQAIATGSYKGLLIDQSGQIFAKPPE